MVYMLYMSSTTLSIDGDRETWECGLGMKAPKPTTQRPEGVIPLQVNVPRDIHARYKAACSLRGVRMSEDLVAHMESAISDAFPSTADSTKPKSSRK